MQADGGELAAVAGALDAAEREARIAGDQRVDGDGAGVDAAGDGMGALGVRAPDGRAEAVYAVRYEMAMTVDDVLSRRTRALILGRDAAVAAAPEVAELLARELGWTTDERTEQVGAFVAQAQRERDAALAPLDV